MLFNSYEFLFLFLPVTFAGFFLLGRCAEKRYATLWLVVASFLFYGYWNWRYVPLLFASIVFNYMIGRKIENTRLKKWLILGIVGNLLLLGYFKYTDFFLANVNAIAGVDCFDLPHIVLPLGISFFTFTQTAYLVDAYRGETANQSFLTYCEFVTIFPHLIAGPIINHREMIPQFVAYETFKINYENIAKGITIFAMGLFKKVVIADTLAVWANDVFLRTESLTFIEAWIGAVSYTFQLYFDFSGYSEMAIGLGLMFNLRLPVNFNSPYRAESIIDFWRRWHMTLGTWVRDYLYIPMGGNKHGEIAKMRNLFLSMGLIGLWHGAGWTFVIWGTMHGFALMINHQWRRLGITLSRFVNIGLTFLCVTLLWVFFRAENFNDAWNVIIAMTDVYNTGLPTGGAWQKYLGALADFGVGFTSWKLGTGLTKVITVLCVLAAALLILPNPIELLKSTKFPSYKWEIATVILLFAGILCITTDSPFLYFQF